MGRIDGVEEFTKDYSKTLSIKDPVVLAAIENRFGDTRDWVKVIEDGYDQSGSKIGFHYFKGPTGEVFGQKLIDFWSRDY